MTPNPTKPKKRRRYRYRSRGDAEDVLDFVERDRNSRHQMINAILNDKEVYTTHGSLGAVGYFLTNFSGYVFVLGKDRRLHEIWEVDSDLMEGVVSALLKYPEDISHYALGMSIVDAKRQAIAAQASKQKEGK